MSGLPNTADPTRLYEELMRVNNEMAAMHRALAKQHEELRVANESLQAEIARRTAAEAQLKQRTEALLRANKDLREFTYGASHDLQEPLRTLTSFSQLLIRRSSEHLDRDSREYLDFITTAARRMQEMIAGLLACARVESVGRSFRPVDLARVLEQTLKSLQADIAPAGASVTVRGALPVVMGDESQIGQVLQNLISNAVRYRSSAPPAIEISAERREDRWLLAVADNGIGIETQYADRVFRLFQRLHTSSEYPGMGIGLTLCKRIVERHGGEIWFASNPGTGTTFYFSLPAAAG